MKYDPKNLKRYDGIYLKQIEKELDARLSRRFGTGMTLIWSSFQSPYFGISGNPER
ncbi:MAG: hypothetical protein U0937_03740 [Thermodesulfovibrionia bacterium]|nr:hypothetical protein [Thermodesulfovibrionia bacterium]